MYQLQKNELLSWYDSSKHFGVRNAQTSMSATEPGRITRVEAPLYNKCSNCNEEDTRCEDPLTLQPLNETVYRTPETDTCYNKDSLEQWFARSNTDPLSRQPLESHPDFVPTIGESEGVALVAQEEEEEITLVYVEVPASVDEYDKDTIEMSMARSAAVNLLGYHDDLITYDNFANYMNALRE